MKKLIILFLAIIISACSPQVSPTPQTSEVLETSEVLITPSNPIIPLPNFENISEESISTTSLPSSQQTALNNTLQTELMAYDEQAKMYKPLANEAVCYDIETYRIGGVSEVSLCRTLIDGEEMVVGFVDGAAMELVPLENYSTESGSVSIYGVWVDDESNIIMPSNPDAIGAQLLPFIAIGVDGKQYIYDENSQKYHPIDGTSGVLEDFGIEEIAQQHEGGTLIGRQRIVFDNGVEYVQTPEGYWVEAVSEAMQTLQADFEKYILSPENYTIVEQGENLEVTDPETGEIVYKNGSFDPMFLGSRIKALGMCKRTEWVTNKIGPSLPGDMQGFIKGYLQPISDAIKVLVKNRTIKSPGNRFDPYHMGDGCWGKLYYRSADQQDAMYFWKDNLGKIKYQQVFLSPKE